MFNPITYFETLSKSLKLTMDKYHFTKVSGLDGLEGVLSSRKHHSFFVAVDDTENGVIVRGKGHGFFNRRPSTIFICAAAEYGDMDQRQTLLAEFREIHRSFCSRLIKDRAEDGLFLLDSSRIPYYEIPGYFANGCVGIYFMIYNDEPTNLAYVQSEWE